MERDLTKYSIPELQEGLAIVDGTRFPENKAALEAELQARRDSGDFDRFIQESKEAEKQQAIDRISFAKKMRKAIAAYLVVSALYAFSGIGMNASSATVGGFMFVFLILFLIATFAGGVGLFLNKPWGHWAAVTVLSLQVVKVQVGGFVFSVLSLIGIYIYAASDWVVGITASFNPGFTLAIGSNAPFWIGVNIFVIPLVVYLFTAQEKAS